VELFAYERDFWTPDSGRLTLLSTERSRNGTRAGYANRLTGAISAPAASFRLHVLPSLRDGPFVTVLNVGRPATIQKVSTSSPLPCSALEEVRRCANSRQTRYLTGTRPDMRSISRASSL
jgi:hypothetical protein